MKGPDHFHLTVDKAGVVSLWDTEEVARKANEGAYVRMVLTGWQSETIQHAQQIAKGERPDGPDMVEQPAAAKK